MKAAAAAGASIVVVGLNGALQKRLILPHDTALVAGNVHRAVSVQVGVGGKGQDVAIALQCLEYRGDLQVAQFVGQGPEGDAVYQLLQNRLGGRNLDGTTVRPQSPMRTCTSIVTATATTELVEPSGLVEEEDMAALLEKLKQQQQSAKQAGATGLCFMGSMPPGCGPTTYAQIYAILASPSTLCLIDSTAGLEPLLTTIAQRPDHGPVVLKLNAAELCKLTKVEQRTHETGVSAEQLILAIGKFLQQYHPYAQEALSAIAITDGAHPAYAAILPVSQDEDEFRLFQLAVPSLMEDDQEEEEVEGTDPTNEQGEGKEETKGWVDWSKLGGNNKSGNSKATSPRVLYPIGAGDAVAAGTLAAWLSLSPRSPTILNSAVEQALEGNESPPARALLSAFAFGLACGSASCLQEENSVLVVEDVLRLYNGDRPMFLSSHRVGS